MAHDRQVRRSALPYRQDGDASGRARHSRNERFRLFADGRFVWTLRRADLAAALADEALTDADATGVASAGQEIVQWGS